MKCKALTPPWFHSNVAQSLKRHDKQHHKFCCWATTTIPSVISESRQKQKQKSKKWAKKLTALSMSHQEASSTKRMYRWWGKPRYFISKWLMMMLSSAFIYGVYVKRSTASRTRKFDTKSNRAFDSFYVRLWGPYTNLMMCRGDETWLHRTSLKGHCD